MGMAVLIVVAAAAEDLQPDRVPPHAHHGHRLQPPPRSAQAHGNATTQKRFAWRNKTVKQYSGRDWVYAYRDARTFTRTRQRTYAGVRHWIRLLENKPESGQYWLGGKVPEPRGRGVRGGPGVHRESCPGGYTPRTERTQYPFCAALWPRGDDDDGTSSSSDQQPPPSPPRGHNYRGGRVMYAIGVGGNAGFQGFVLNMSKTYRLHM